MKTLLALLGSLAFTFPSPAQTAASDAPGAPAAPAKPQPRIDLSEKTDAPKKDAANAEAKARADKAAAKKKADAAKKNAPGKIEGVEIARGAKGFLGVQIVDATFKLSFYDAKKKPVAADMTSAALRWDSKNKIGKEYVLLTLGGDGKSLTSPKAIRPPYYFKLTLTLLKEASETTEAASETYVIDFQQ